MRHADRASGGFTLIELLVVITIIALLAAGLFPALSSARAQARQALCQSNLHQVSLGLEAYSEDLDAYPAARVERALESQGDREGAMLYCLLPYVLAERCYVDLKLVGCCPESFPLAKYVYNADPRTGLCCAELDSDPAQWIAACGGWSGNRPQTWTLPGHKEADWHKSDMLLTSERFPFWSHKGKRLVLYTSGRVDLEVKPRAPKKQGDH